MAASPTKFKLNTSAYIPAIGLGTWQDEDAQEKAVLTALEAGYRHIDTAAIYGTEAAIGRALKKCGIPRDQIFITSKLWNNKHHPDDVDAALSQSLKDLGVSYVDLYLMHWPVAFARGNELFPQDEQGKRKIAKIDYVDTYKAMEKLQQSGKTKAIGISNFSKAEVERLLANSSIVPAVHQMELHPWLQQEEFVKFHASKGIHITQYSSLGNQNEIYNREKVGRMLDDPVLKEVAEKTEKTCAQVALGMCEFDFFISTAVVAIFSLTGISSIFPLSFSMGNCARPLRARQVQDARTHPAELAI
ncbi:alcohol dehydrogenase (NADP+) [Blastomyces dermatitidis ATCC 18188]|uniref:D-xylose reductase [NAD(P)H] n=1 Tax=Ajellomyces dermatitidis (strain ATCC 18188 / CBS 674.68) TaxID=653446 RepID=F2TKW2_AJEDA|nr:alcohol dehydrogenase (NADP+) [Blastomyces dermatitidis ATCC 18188]